MRKVIDGKVYDTDRAEKICDVTPQRARSLGRSDFGWEDTTLYQTANGRFFIAGEGGAMSRWAQPVGQSGRTGGGGAEAVTQEEAKRLVEEFASAEVYERVFGVPEEA